jgi:hypothetical protein
MDNKILVSILTHRCQCPHDRLKRGGDRGGATNIHNRKLSSEPHVKKRYKLGNHLFHTPDFLLGIMFGKKYILSLGLINLLIVQNYRITVQPILDFFPICSCLIQVKSFTDITLESRRTSASTSLFVNYEFNFRVKKRRGQTSRKTRTSFKKLFHYSFLFLLKVVF